MIHVVVVDDSAFMRKAISTMLEKDPDIKVVATGRDGEEGLELVRKFNPDVVTLDIEMPRMDGFEVATLVRHDERLKDLPIVMITSRTGEKHRDRALSIGVNEYLGKPYQESVLLEAIQRLVHADV